MTDGPQHTYRLMGIWDDGTRVLLTNRVTIETAGQKMSELSAYGHMFKRMAIEDEVSGETVGEWLRP
jgi:hypothetical protein